MAVRDVIRDYISSSEGKGLRDAIGKVAGTTGASETNGTAGTTEAAGAADGFNGSTLGDVEDFLRNRLEYHKSLEESDADRQKRERRERTSKNLAAIGDILGAMHRAYSYQRGVQAMDVPSLSDKAQSRIDTARAERDKNADRIMNYAITLDKLNSSKAQSDYQQKILAIRQQQQDRLDKQEETNRNIAEAKVKSYEAQSNKNDEQAAYWKTKAELLERGWPQEQAEKAARIEERKARAAKYRRDAAAPYGKGGGGGSSSGRGSSSSRSTENDGNMLGRAAVEDPEGYKEAVSVVTGGPYGTVNNSNRSQIAGAYRAQQRRKQQSKAQQKSRSQQSGGKGRFSSFSIHK